MAKRTFVIPASFSFRHVAETLAKDDDFVRDAFHLLHVDEAVFDGLLQALTEPRFLGRIEIRNVVERALGEGEPAEKIARLIGRLSAMVRQAEEPAPNAMALLREAITAQCDREEAEQHARIADRLERLILEPPGLTQQHKAEQLASLFEAELDEVQIICDVRPVFNDDRTEIQGAVPVSRLVLDLTRSDGTSLRTEVGITESQILELRDRVEAAIRKIDTIKTFLKTPTTVHIPSTTATTTSEN